MKNLFFGRTNLRQLVIGEHVVRGIMDRLSNAGLHLAEEQIQGLSPLDDFSHLPGILLCTDGSYTIRVPLEGFLNGVYFQESTDEYARAYTRPQEPTPASIEALRQRMIRALTHRDLPLVDVVLDRFDRCGTWGQSLTMEVRTTLAHARVHRDALALCPDGVISFEVEKGVMHAAYHQGAFIGMAKTGFAGFMDFSDPTVSWSGTRTTLFPAAGCSRVMQTHAESAAEVIDALLAHVPVPRVA